MAKQPASSARAKRTAETARYSRRKIDYSDIPQLSAAQIAVMRRVGRPPLGDAARQMISIRIDGGILDGFRQEAERRQIGYQVLINQVLARFAAKGYRF